MHPLDKALIATCPTTIAPKYGKFQLLRHHQRRLVVAFDGLWLELTNAWLHFLWPIGPVKGVAIPYGAVERRIDYSFPSLPVDLLARFLLRARSYLPNEYAAWIVWNENTQSLEYCELPIRHSSEGSITFVRPKFPEHLHCCIDVHSHGREPAFFSSIDDIDDSGECKVSIVFGNLDCDEPTSAYRLCAAGLFIPLTDDLNPRR